MDQWGPSNASLIQTLLRCHFHGSKPDNSYSRVRAPRNELYRLPEELGLVLFTMVPSLSSILPWANIEAWFTLHVLNIVMAVGMIQNSVIAAAT